MRGRKQAHISKEEEAKKISEVTTIDVPDWVKWKWLVLYMTVKTAIFLTHATLVWGNGKKFQS